jgi:cytochrome c-type biogenesis protein
VVHAFLAGLSDALVSGSWGIIPVIFLFSIIASFNPCMLSMVPLIIGGTRHQGFLKVSLFCTGFTAMLILLGTLSAILGRNVIMPNSFWGIFLGAMYLIIGMVMLKEYLPFRYSILYVSNKKPLISRLFTKQVDLSPFSLGLVFALSPSPCTVPAVVAIASYTIATGKLLFGAVALGAFAIGHSLVLAITFLPSVRKKIRSLAFLRNFKPIIGALLIILALYFLISQPEFLNNNNGMHEH